MGAASSTQGGGAAGGAEQRDAGASSQHRREALTVQGPTKSWATMDHTLSGPWSFLLKEEVQCLCEGGRSCTREDPARQRGGGAVPGLHASWVCDGVLAMARPWQENVLRHDLPARLSALGVGLIVNLQEVGEHAACGPGNLPSSGFTYQPEAFMAARIEVCNRGWRDMGVPTLELMLDIVQVMQRTAAEGKRIAVHCHAGLGRTGLAIACFLVASGQAASAAAAVDAVRAARPGSLQTSAQVVFVSIFEQYLSHLRCLFKVADLKQLHLGNSSYSIAKAARRISRSLSGSVHHAGAPPDPLAAASAAAAAVFGPCAVQPPQQPQPQPQPQQTAGDGGAARGEPDWASATYELLSPAEAAALPSTAEAAANAALNLAPAAAGRGDAGGGGGGGAGGGGGDLIVHARRMSGGSSLVKVTSHLSAITEEADRPVHVITTDSAVTEVYGHGLTIIRATDSARKLQAASAPPSPEQRPRERLPTTQELGLDKQLPWTDRFAIRPEVFSPEGWLPEPPSSYIEALRRQQRLLHGTERRRCLHVHKLLKAAAKALAAAAQAYNAVPQHSDSSSPATSAPSSCAASNMRRMHSRSRSNAAAVDLLALSAGISISPCSSSSGVGGAGGGPAGPQPCAAAAAAAAAAGGLGKPADGASPLQTAAVTAACLLPGVHLGPPGTGSSLSAAGAAALSGSGAGSGRSLSRTHSSSSGGGGGRSRHAGAGAAAGTAPGSPVSAPPLLAAMATPCLAGCCAPSFAAGLLVALLYRGRFPEEYEAQWSACPRLQVLGLAEGHAMCAALQDTKLRVNAGDYVPLERAPGAVAVCVLSDWFEGFADEALSEASLELLVDEAEALLAEAQAAAAAARAGSAAGATPTASVVQQAQQQEQQPQEAQAQAQPSPEPASSAQPPAGSDEQLVRRATARAVCCALAPHEQDLCLLLAAVLRHARHASLDDTRLAQAAAAQAADAGAARMGSAAAGPAAVEAEVDAAVAALCRLAAGWLLGPLALACGPALDAVVAFLQFLVLDDAGYSCLLQASRDQGVRRVRTQPAARSGEWEPGAGAGSRGAPASPRGAKQKQQPHETLERLKARLKGGGSPKTAAAPSRGVRSKLSKASSSPQLGRAAAAGGKQPAAGDAGPVLLHVRRCSPPAGCADGLTSLLGHKLLQALLSKPPVLPVRAPRGNAKGSGGAGVPPVQELPQPGAVASAQPSAASLAGDSCSHTIQLGSQELCVGRPRGPGPHVLDPGQGVGGGAACEDAAAAGPGSRQLGALDSPPQSTSPEPPGAPRSRSRQQQHSRLPALRQDAGSVGSAASSAAGSPASSLGSMCGVLLAAHGGGTPQQAAAAGGIDVCTSQPLSVSALSELQLPSLPSSVSLAALRASADGGGGTRVERARC